MYRLLRNPITPDKAMALKPGSIVAVRYPVYTHVGLLSDQHDEHGTPLVISNSRRTGAIREESWDDFSGGGRRVFFVGYPSARTPDKVLSEARSRMDRQPSYNVLWNNCEHFVSSCHGLPRLSPQIIRAGAVVGLGASLTLATLPYLVRRR